MTSRKDTYPIFDQIAPHYDLLNRVLSVGIDRQWRRIAAGFLPKDRPLRILDLATGTGDLIIAMIREGERNGASITHLTGTDMSPKMIMLGRSKLLHAITEGKVSLQIADAAALPFEAETFDICSIAFGIRNIPDYEQALREMNRVTASNGLAIVLEFSIPKNPIIRAFYMFYFRTLLPVIGGLVSGHRSAYRYLNQSVETFPNGVAFADALQRAGFTTVECVPLTFGIATIYVAKKSPAA